MMLRSRSFLVAVITVSLLGCATGSYPATPEQYRQRQLQGAKESFAKGQRGSAGAGVDELLTTSAGVALIESWFREQPKARTAYLEYLGGTLAQIKDPVYVMPALTRLDRARASHLFTESEMDALYEALNKLCVEGNQNGTLPFTLANDFEMLPRRWDPAQERIIVDRSMNALLSSGLREKALPKLMEYVRRSGGPTSAEGQRIGAMLPSLNIKQSELEVIAALYPDYAARRKTQTTMRATLKVKGSDRLFQDDISSALRRGIKGLVWESGPSSGVLAIVVEKVRSDERTIPERTETITYAQYQVNFAEAVLLMPRNASYLYDIKSGGVELEYGYVISEELDGKVSYEETVRGKLVREYRRCENARIQNVFGGVSPAGFVANADMQGRCGGPSTATMDEVRQDVLSRIVAGVLKIPAVNAINEIN